MVHLGGCHGHVGETGGHHGHRALEREIVTAWDSFLTFVERLRRGLGQQGRHVLEGTTHASPIKGIIGRTVFAVITHMEARSC